MAGETARLQAFNFSSRFPLFIYTKEQELELYKMCLNVPYGELFLYVSFEVH